MAYKPRWYQEEAAEALSGSVILEGVNAIAVMPTGSGKTYTICETINRVLTEYPLANVVVVSHVAEILEQNHASLSSFFEGIEIGLYSASLGERAVKQITVAGIQSVFKKPDLFGERRTFLIVDECHIVPDDEKSMYRKFINNLKNCHNILGLTATPFRTGRGYIYKGKEAIFNCVCYDLSSFNNYNKLVEQGFLSPLVGKNTHIRLRADEEKIKTTAGDYNQKELSLAFDRATITDGAINELLHFGKDRKLWLIFAIDIAHAMNIADNLREKGIETACVHSKMEEERGQVIADIKAGKYRAVVNVDVLTTGFDAPNIDLIGVLRPTKSTGLHVQMLGRGARVSPGKENCMVLDFAGNIERLGPINDPVVLEPGGKKKEGGDPIMKECPECMGLNYGFAKFCFNCEYEFIFKEKIKSSASEAAAMKLKLKEWVDVKSVGYSIHQKKDNPSSLRVTYNCGLGSFSEWICYDHKGFARHRARNWVKTRWPDKNNLPDNLNELYANARMLSTPKRIFVDISSKYPEIKSYDF